MTVPRSELRTFTARWVFPVSSRPWERGTITIQGERILAVEPHGVRSPDENLGNVAVIPGLVNAHTHLDLSGAQGRIPATSPEQFTDWLHAVIAYRRSRSAAQIHDDITTGLAACLRFGTTLLGDITADGQSWEILNDTAVSAVVFRELIGLSAERAEAAKQQAQEWQKTARCTKKTLPGLSPHAPYSVRKELFRFAAETEEPLAIHLAESPGERELLASHSGPFVKFLQSIGAWDPSGLAPGPDWFLNPQPRGRTLFVHGNDLSIHELRHLNRDHSVVYCPRTHAAFGHTPHPFREFLRQGIRVCLGTDSLASNPDLDIFAEAQFLQQHHPDLEGETLLRMVTLAGAEALGQGTDAGSLEPGKFADLVVMPLPDRESEDPYELLFATDGERRTMWHGTWR